MDFEDDDKSLLSTDIDTMSISYNDIKAIEEVVDKETIDFWHRTDLTTHNY